MKLADIKKGDTIKLARFGTKWIVEERREPCRTFFGYVALRSIKGTFKVIGSENWDIPIIKCQGSIKREGRK